MMDCDGFLSPSHPYLLLSSPAGSLLTPRPPHFSTCPKNMPVPPLGHGFLLIPPPSLLASPILGSAHSSQRNGLSK